MTLQPLINAIAADVVDRPYLYNHDYVNSRQIPFELAEAQDASVAAWLEYDQVIDRDHDARESQDALSRALAADNAVRDWHGRWQRLGGTSDIRSIVEAEAPVAFEPMRKVIHFMEG
jgi:hypothetical protein